jgi:hypothetical protein
LKKKHHWFDPHDLPIDAKKIRISLDSIVPPPVPQEVLAV